MPSRTGVTSPTLGVREAAVRASRGLLEQATDVRVGADLGAAERSDLQERDAIEVLRVVLQEPLVGGKPLDEPLAVVEPVDADHATPAAQAVDEALHRVARLARECIALDAVDIDADREHVDRDASRAAHDAAVVGDCALAPQFNRRRAQRGRVASRLHADQVIREQRFHELGVHRQRTQRLDVRERDVQEKADRQRDAELAQALAQREQLVVVHPDEIGRLEQRAHAGRESRVDAVIRRILVVAVAERVEEVVAQRP
jgi:hypothetical protein